MKKLGIVFESYERSIFIAPGHEEAVQELVAKLGSESFDETVKVYKQSTGRNILA